MCSILPSTLSTECLDFINTYGPAVLILIEDELTPDEVCKSLGLCSKTEQGLFLIWFSGSVIIVQFALFSKFSAFIEASKPKKNVEDGELCIVCETLVQYLDSMLSQNATQQEIEEALEKVCNFLPDQFKQEVGLAENTLVLAQHFT